jgi:predicted urease superfamily metal-dependent hydrolase
MKSVTHTYSLTEYHIMTVKLMAEESGLSEGLIVRNAIDLLREQYAQMGKVARVHQFREAAEEEVPAIHSITRISDLLGD